jgi:hypothetical protein
LIASFFVLIPVFLFAGKFEEEIVPLLKNSCLKCHGGEKTKGKVDFSAILTERDAGDHLDLWETVIEVVELGEMPPEEENPLSTDERSKIRTWRDEFMRLPTVSSIPVFRPRRLSANEYRNTLRSLFGFDLEVGIARAEQTESGDKSLILKILPPDPPGKSGFFNDTHSTPLSSSLLENYAYLAGISLDRLFSIQGKDSLTRMTRQNEDWNGEITPNLAEEIVRSFLPRIFRRPIKEERINSVFEQLKGKKGKALVAALKFEFKAALISPEFLYRGFLAKPVENKNRQPVDPFELAERLSYFLWEDMPDEELFESARDGSLLEKGGVGRQIVRMLTDPRARNLSESFGVQLLGLSSIDDQIKNNPIHLHAMRTQPRDFLHYLFTEDRPVMELLDSNITFVNQSTSGFYGNDRKRLAPFHKPRGIERQRTMNQRLEIKEAEGRGGILTMPSILSMNHGPILRGTWVLRTILGVRLGEPPGDVPPIKPVPRGKKMTFRERFEAHRENVTCARCHEKIDPIGFALDGYDKNGKYLLASHHKPGNQPAIDTSGKLPSGEEFKDFEGLKHILTTTKKEQVIRNLTRQILSYALGRKLGRGDQGVVEKITDKATSENSSWKELLIEVANSASFREIVFKEEDIK